MYCQTSQETDLELGLKFLLIFIKATFETSKTMIFICFHFLLWTISEFKKVIYDQTMNQYNINANLSKIKYFKAAILRYLQSSLIYLKSLPKMNPTIPHKKHSLSTRKQIQTMLRKQARNHQKSNSMMDFLQIIGNDKLNEFSQRAHQSHSSSNQETVEEMVQRQFIALKNKIQIYCKQFNKFVQNHQIEMNPQQKGLWITNSIAEEDIFNLFTGRIREFIRDTSLTKITQQNTLKKPQLCSSSSDSLNLQSMSMNLGEQTEGLQRIENIEVLEVYNNSRNIQRQTSPEPDAQNRVRVSQVAKQNYTMGAQNFINSLPISCSSTVSEILYKQARLRSFPQFHKFCQKILLEKKPIISDFHFFKKQKLDKTNFYLGEIYRKLNVLNTKLELTATGDMNFVKRESFGGSEQKGKNIGRQIDEICMVLKKLNQLHNLNSLVFDCSRPCCKSQQAPLTTSTKAKILLNLKQSAKKSIHYNTEATEEYFNRYYRNESFDRTKIYSLTKTKTQEMERLEKTYYRIKGNKKTCKKRCNSLFENII